MKRLSIVFVNSVISAKSTNDDIEIIYTDNKNIRQAINNAQGKYISFICNEDEVTPNYFDAIYSKTFEEFDTCYINHNIDLGLPRENKKNYILEYLGSMRPYYLEYLWSFVYKTSVLQKIIEFGYDYEFDSKIDDIVKIGTAIPEEIYIHYPNNNESTIEDIPFVDYKIVEYHKNVIYLKNTLTAIFNGVITWVTNIGKIFGDKYDITIIYDDIYEETRVKLSKYFKLEHREKYKIYICDRFIETYLDYNIPNNIFYAEESSVFVTGVMIEDDCLYPDLYDRYFGVSKACRDSIKFGFDTTYKPEYIHNPIMIDNKDIKPHLKLVSTLRSEECKGLSRLEKISEILDEEDIPYTWNVFTDTKEGTNHSGFIYRNSVFNALSYVKDADYLVMCSDIESFCYSVIESLLLDTKVVVTPVKVFEELGVKDGENGFIIPFEYFEDENKEKLREKVLEIYNNKDKKIKYKEADLNYKEFGNLLKK